MGSSRPNADALYRLMEYSEMDAAYEEGKSGFPSASPNLKFIVGKIFCQRLT